MRERSRRLAWRTPARLTCSAYGRIDLPPSGVGARGVWAASRCEQHPPGSLIASVRSSNGCGGGGGLGGFGRKPAGLEVEAGRGRIIGVKVRSFSASALMRSRSSRARLRERRVAHVPDVSVARAFPLSLLAAGASIASGTARSRRISEILKSRRFSEYLGGSRGISEDLPLASPASATRPPPASEAAAWSGAPAWPPRARSAPRGQPPQAASAPTSASAPRPGWDASGRPPPRSPPRFRPRTPPAAPPPPAPWPPPADKAREGVRRRGASAHASRSRRARSSRARSSMRGEIWGDMGRYGEMWGGHAPRGPAPPCAGAASTGP